MDYLEIARKKMSKKILFDINHPAHVHFFKNVIFELKKQNDYAVFVTSTNKEISEELLKLYEIDFINIGYYRNGLIKKFLDFLIVGYRFIRIVRKLKPDLILSVSSARPFGGLVSNAKTYIFTDTEHATEQIALFKPFATKILTPDCFLKDLGKKQIRYPGFHELAYLHKSRFKPNPAVLYEIGLNENSIFFILRFVSWQATHDIGQKGISLKNKRKLIKMLEPFGKILISSEKPLSKEFEPYRVMVAPSKMHDLLYFANLYVGEGATMASEAAMIGTPAIYVNSLDSGTLQEQERLGLLYNLRNDSTMIALVESYLQKDLLNKKKRRKETLSKLIDKIDVTDYTLKLIENINR